jgi:predicted site-specific integrase-resolvase
MSDSGSGLHFKRRQQSCLMEMIELGQVKLAIIA